MNQTNNDFSIRRAAPHDETAILEILAQAFEPYRTSYTPGAFADTVLTPETLRQRLAAMIVLVAVAGSGRVLGTVAYKIDPQGEGHLRGMAVLPDCQGSGVAQALLARVERDVRALHCPFLTLDTTAPLERAIRFYESNGFRATGEVRSFFGMDLFPYRKELA